MDDATPDADDSRPAHEPEVLAPSDGDASSDSEPAITEPARVMRIGSMIKQLLDEVREAPLDEASRVRLKDIYETSVAALADSLSPDLRDELHNLTHPFASETPSEGELRVAKAQLVGWLEGLFQGMQAALFAQQMAARAQLEQMRNQAQIGPGGPPADGAPPHQPPGVYL